MAARALSPRAGRAGPGHSAVVGAHPAGGGGRAPADPGRRPAGLPESQLPHLRPVCPPGARRVELADSSDQPVGRAADSAGPGRRGARRRAADAFRADRRHAGILGSVGRLRARAETAGNLAAGIAGRGRGGAPLAKRSRAWPSLPRVPAPAERARPVRSAGAVLVGAGPIARGPVAALRARPPRFRRRLCRLHAYRARDSRPPGRPLRIDHDQLALGSGPAARRVVRQAPENARGVAAPPRGLVGRRVQRAAERLARHGSFGAAPVCQSGPRGHVAAGDRHRDRGRGRRDRRDRAAGPADQDAAGGRRRRGQRRGGGAGRRVGRVPIVDRRR